MKYETLIDGNQVDSVHKVKAKTQQITSLLLIEKDIEGKMLSLCAQYLVFATDKTTIYFFNTNTVFINDKNLNHMSFTLNYFLEWLRVFSIEI